MALLNNAIQEKQWKPQITPEIASAPLTFRKESPLPIEVSARVLISNRRRVPGLNSNVN